MKNVINFPVKIFLILLLSGFSHDKVLAQVGKIDSLATIYRNANNDKVRVKALVDIVNNLAVNDVVKGVEYSDTLIHLSERVDDIPLKVEAIYASARTRLFSYDHAQMFLAQRELEELLNIDSIPEIKEYRINARILLGFALTYFDEAEKALDQYFLVVQEDGVNPTTLSAAYSNIGRTYQEDGDLGNAEKYFRKSLELVRKLDNDQFLVTGLGDLAFATQDISEAEALLSEAITLVESKDIGHIAKSSVYREYGQLLFKTNNPRKALIAFRKSLNSSIKANDLVGQSSFATGAGKCFMELNKLDSAGYYFEKAYDLNKAISNNLNVSNAAEDLATYFARVGKHELAYTKLLESFTLKDSMYDEEKAQSLSLNAIRFETLEKENRIAQQELDIAKKDSQRNRIIGGSAILLLLLGGIFSWYFERQKRKKQKAELDLQIERKEKKQLQELDEMKMQFFTNVSHELKTPLTLVMGPLSQVLENISDSDLKKKIVTAYNNAERLDELINETLDFRKLEKGSISIFKTTSGIAKDLRRMFFGFSSLAEIRNIKLIDKIRIEDDVFVTVDVEKLEKIVNNLVSNAIKFSENDRQIELTAHYDDELLTISVTDYGSGIAEDEIDKIFNRFYQAKHNLSGNYGGTGVGLAFSRQLAEALNGFLTAKSQLGTGSTFTLTIPAESVEQINKASEDIEIQEESQIKSKEYIPILINGEQPDILIVEDNHEMQEYLGSILDPLYRCHFANDGFEAIKKVQTQKYHLISSDVMMPNMDGFRLKEKINEISQAKSIPFIFLTARSLEEDKLAGLRLGVDDYVTKPFNKEEYQTRVYNLLKNFNERLDGVDGSALFKYTESVDKQKLKEAEQKVLENISNPGFKVSELADHLHYSQRQLARVIQHLTGLTPVGFILELRLQRAYHLIKSNAYESISEVRGEVGIESSSYFSRKFKERFGVSPSDV